MKIPLLTSISLLLTTIVCAEVHLYVLETDEKPGLVEVREDSLSILGFRSESPDLVIKELTNVFITESPFLTPQEKEGVERENTYHLTIEWTDSDRIKFHELTKRSLRKRIMFVVDGTPISAPMLMDEVSSPSVWVTFREKEEAQRILKHLDPLVNEK